MKRVTVYSYTDKAVREDAPRVTMAKLAAALTQGGFRRVGNGMAWERDGIELVLQIEDERE